MTVNKRNFLKGPVNDGFRSLLCMVVGAYGSILVMFIVAGILGKL